MRKKNDTPEKKAKKTKTEVEVYHTPQDYIYAVVSNRTGKFAEDHAGQIAVFREEYQAVAYLLDHKLLNGYRIVRFRQVLADTFLNWRKRPRRIEER